MRRHVEREVRFPFRRDVRRTALIHVATVNDVSLCRSEAQYAGVGCASSGFSSIPTTPVDPNGAERTRAVNSIRK